MRRRRDASLRLRSWVPARRTAAAGIATFSGVGGVPRDATRRAWRTRHRTHRAIPATRRRKPGFGERSKRPDFRGNVRFKDGPTTAEAPRAVYSVVKDTFDLSRQQGDRPVAANRRRPDVGSARPDD